MSPAELHADHPDARQRRAQRDSLNQGRMSGDLYELLQTITFRELGQKRIPPEGLPDEDADRLRGFADFIASTADFCDKAQSLTNEHWNC
jgi:hypothetical protein